MNLYAAAAVENVHEKAMPPGRTRASGCSVTEAWRSEASIAANILAVLIADAQPALILSARTAVQIHPGYLAVPTRARRLPFPDHATARAVHASNRRLRQGDHTHGKRGQGTEDRIGERQARAGIQQGALPAVCSLLDLSDQVLEVLHRKLGGK
jgi:hypothetical protein